MIRILLPFLLFTTALAVVRGHRRPPFVEIRQRRLDEYAAWANDPERIAVGRANVDHAIETGLV